MMIVIGGFDSKGMVVLMLGQSRDFYGGYGCGDGWRGEAIFVVNIWVDEICVYKIGCTMHLYDVSL